MLQRGDMSNTVGMAGSGAARLAFPGPSVALRCRSHLVPFSPLIAALVLSASEARGRVPVAPEHHL